MKKSLICYARKGWQDNETLSKYGLHDWDMKVSIPDLFANKESIKWLDITPREWREGGGKKMYDEYVKVRVTIEEI